MRLHQLLLLKVDRHRTNLDVRFIHTEKLRVAWRTEDLAVITSHDIDLVLFIVPHL